jgi:hypothetical protein
VNVRPLSTALSVAAILGGGLVAVGALAQAPVQTNGETKAVVELFTSQG